MKRRDYSSELTCDKQEDEKSLAKGTQKTRSVVNVISKMRNT